MDWTLAGQQITVIGLLVLVLVAGSRRVWVWGYIDKAKDEQIERIQGLLDTALENGKIQSANFERALDLLEATVPAERRPKAH